MTDMSSLTSKGAGARVTLTGVSKQYPTARGKQLVLDHISMDIAPGEFISLVGPSGCGKSTLLRLIAGLDPEYNGSVIFGGHPVNGPQADCGVLFQEHRLFPWLTVEDNVALGAFHEGLSRDELKQHVQTQLTHVRLDGWGHAYPQQLSGGMAQRASIARMMIGSRAVLLLDEPFSALDAFTRMKMQVDLETLWHNSGKTMMLVTHDIEEAVYLSDRIVVMDAKPGRIRKIVQNPLPRPRDRVGPAFAEVKARLFSLLEI